MARPPRLVVVLVTLCGVCLAGASRAQMPREHEEPLPSFQAQGGVEVPLLEPVEARDPRVVEADGYLANRDTYADATALYREYLAERPEDDAVRLRLARVISWSGRLDDSLVEYDTLARPGADAVVFIERAEVLSWAGRYRKAERAFKEVLESDATNTRAARGLARTYLWSGRSYEADRAYVRALEMGDDEEARSEWEGLHALFRPQLSGRASRRSDNDNFFFQSFDTRGTSYLSLRTRVSGEASYWQSRGEVDLGGGSRERRNRDAAVYSVGVEHHLSPVWLTKAEVGHEAWVGAPDQVRANAELRFTPVDQTSMSLGYQHSGAGKTLDSFDAIESGVRLDALSFSLWQDLSKGFEFWGQVGGGWLSDDNRRIQSAFSLSYQPFEDHQLGLHLSNSVLHYERDSDLYYDPDLEVDNQISVDYVRPLLLGVRVRVEGAVGYGISREAGELSDGFVFRTGSYLWWEWQRWALEVGGTFSQSRRSNAYRSHFFTAAITRSF